MPCTVTSSGPGQQRRSRSTAASSIPAAKRDLQVMNVGVLASCVPSLAPMKPELHITTKPTSANTLLLPTLPVTSLNKRLRTPPPRAVVANLLPRLSSAPARHAPVSLEAATTAPSNLSRRFVAIPHGDSPIYLAHELHEPADQPRQHVRHLVVPFRPGPVTRASKHTGLYTN